MKVVHLVPAMEQGGVETVVLALNRIVVEAGWESVVVSRGGRLVARLEADGGRHVALDVKSKNPLTFFTRALALRRLLRAEKPDLVCVHSRVPAWLFVWADRPLGLRWLSYAHGANSVSRYSEVMTRGDLTVVPSRYLADYLKRNYALPEERLRIVNPAVDFARFDPANCDAAFVAERRRRWGLAEGDFVVMSVGRITPLKGCDALIRACASLANRLPRLRLVFVGDADRHHADYLASLRRLAAELGLGERIVFAGGETKVPECLSLASVVVSANLKKPESFGLSMAEALAMGKPVVAKRFGGALEIVRDGVDGLLVDGDDFAPAILDVASRRFEGLRDGAINRFSFARLASLTCKLYQGLISHPSPARPAPRPAPALPPRPLASPRPLCASVPLCLCVKSPPTVAALSCSRAAMRGPTHAAPAR